MSAENRLRFFEDLVIGERRTIEPFSFDRDAIIGFAELYDPFPFHLDEAVAAKSMLRGLAASGWQSTITAQWLITTRYFADLAYERSLGARDVRWSRPAMVDALLTGDATLSGLDDVCPIPGCGLAVITARLSEPTGETVMSADFWLAVRRGGPVARAAQ